MARHEKSTNPIDLTQITHSCSDTGVGIASELYRRSAVDLVRVASALCPAH
jgi:hypothetical protein